MNRMATIQEIIEAKFIRLSKENISRRRFRFFMQYVHTQRVLNLIAVRRFRSGEVVDCSKPCDTCAFTKGTEANLEPDNLLKAQVCVLTPHPFYCHHEIDWKNPKLPKKLSAQEKRSLGTKICRGWKNEVNKLAVTGYYKEDPLVTKLIGTKALQDLQFWLSKESKNDSEYRDEVWEQFSSAIKKLGAKRKRFEVNG